MIFSLQLAHTDGVAGFHGKADFSFREPLCQHYLSFTEHHLVSSPNPQSDLSSINHDISISTKSRSLDGPLRLPTFGFGVHTTYLSHIHLALVLSTITQLVSVLGVRTLSLESAPLRETCLD